jgi:hypothetical protein
MASGLDWRIPMAFYIPQGIKQVGENPHTVASVPSSIIAFVASIYLFGWPAWLYASAIVLAVLLLTYTWYDGRRLTRVERDLTNQVAAEKRRADELEQKLGSTERENEELRRGRDIPVLGPEHYLGATIDLRERVERARRHRKIGEGLAREWVVVSITREGDGPVEVLAAAPHAQAFNGEPGSLIQKRSREVLTTGILQAAGDRQLALRVEFTSLPEGLQDTYLEARRFNPDEYVVGLAGVYEEPYSEMKDEELARLDERLRSVEEAISEPLLRAE